VIEKLGIFGLNKDDVVVDSIQFLIGSVGSESSSDTASASSASDADAAVISTDAIVSGS
jgi:hypothetical protein